METTTVKVGAIMVPLTAPTSVSLRADVCVAANLNMQRAGGAALGLCWSGPGKPKAKLAKYKHVLNEYGGAVIDELAATGVPLVEIFAAGTTAIAMCSDGLVWSAEVDEAEGFSEAGAPSTGTSSTSSGSTI